MTPVQTLASCLVGMCIYLLGALWRAVVTEREVHRLKVEGDIRDREVAALRGRIQYLETVILDHRTDLETAARIALRHEERLSRLESGVVVLHGGRDKRVS